MKKILIVDDKEENRQVMKNFFKFFGRKAEIELFFADSGVSAYDIIQMEKPDLVFLDIFMETRDAGLKLAQKVRETIMEKHINLWALTATAMKGTADMEGDEEKCLRYGCDKYYSKPFDQKQMLVEVSSLLNLEIPPKVKARMGLE